MSEIKVLVVDDEEVFAHQLQAFFQNIDSVQAFAAGSGEEALLIANRERPSVVVMDIRMPGMNGVDALQKIKAIDPTIMVIVLSAIDDVKIAVSAFRHGAENYVLKPVNLKELKYLFEIAVEKRKLLHENRRLNEEFLSQVDERTKELKESQEILKSIAEVAGDAIVMIDGTGSVIFWNPVAEKMFGYTTHEAIDHKIDQLIIPDEFKSRHIKSLEMFAVTGKGAAIGQTVPLIGKRKDGSLFPVDLTLTSIRDRQKKWKALGIIHDATERKKAEDALRKSKEYLARVVETIVEGIYIVDADGNIVFTNKASEDIFGLPKEELYNRSYNDKKWSVKKGDGTEMREEDYPFARVKSTKKPVRGIEILSTCPDGRTLTVLINAAPMYDEAGRFQGMVATQQDISDKKRKEYELRQAHRENEELFAAINSVMIKTDKDGTIQRLNNAASSLFGQKYTKGMRLQELDLGWDYTIMFELMERCLKSNKSVRSDDIKYIGPDNKERFIGFSVSPIRGEESEIAGFLFLGSDLTERRILEGQLTQAQKLESIGSLAAGIAHEINTPTQFTGDNIHFLKDSFEGLMRLVGKYREMAGKEADHSITRQDFFDIRQLEEDVDIDYLIEEIPSAIESCLNGISRVSKIVKAMKEFSHPATKEKVMVDLNKIIESTITISRNEWKYVSDLYTDFSYDVGMVPCFPDEFNQVILNMITNSAHSISEKLGEGSEEKGRIDVSTKRDSKNVIIKIKDNGNGIPEKIKEKVFDHFFTTKEVGRGTGQGLSISRSVITEKHGGTISFESVEGEGTTFRITLPLEVE